MCRNTEARRGAMTTPTNCDRLDSRCAAWLMTRCGDSAPGALNSVTRGIISSRRTVSMVSTKSR